MKRQVTINPISRLEGHGKIDIFLDAKGDVEHAAFIVPELRGFEKFVEGRPAEDMPQITSRICGVCPSAHHMAATKALDALFGVEPPPAAKLIREFYYDIFMFEDHLLHFFFLGGPDFIVGPDAPKESRNILGVIEKVGVDIGKQVIDIRKRAREWMSLIGGKPIHPVLGLPGGVAKAISKSDQKKLTEFGKDAVAFAQFTLKAFHDLVLSNKEYVKLILSDTYRIETHSMGMVDSKNRANWVDGKIRIVDLAGKEIEKFLPKDYADIVAEHVEPWTYIKFPYLRKKGWKGFIDGSKSSIVRVAPLARLNTADSLSTPLAQAEAEKMFKVLGGKPSQYTLALHWARLVEVLHAAERILELSKDPQLYSPEIRNLNFKTPKEGVGIVEAPRGTLIHHYTSDKNGMITSANLMVATLFNSPAINISIEKAAKKLISKGKVNDGLLNMIEMAFRAYDPCLSCATHSLPGKMPLVVQLKNEAGEPLQKVTWNESGDQVTV